jgi:hypothetical protein
MYSALQSFEPATVWVPAAYEPFVATVLNSAPWPRDTGSARGHSGCPVASVVGSSYDALNRTGVVQVDVVGGDLVAVVDDTLSGLQHAGADMVMVRLPANQPALATQGAGLGSLGLGYASYLPTFGAMGDALVLQWLRDPDVDQSSWVFANDAVGDFARRVARHVVEVGGRQATLRRRDALRHQLLAALPGGDGPPDDGAGGGGAGGDAGGAGGTRR